jgi:hypothetical protein
MPSDSRKLRVEVVFDTNALFSGSCSNLVSKATRDLIERHSDHPDIHVNWHLPKSVINERQYQMLRKASDLLPSVEKLEALLGHNLGINNEILNDRIVAAIERDKSALGLNSLDPEYNSIDWSDIERRSAFRHPPFDSSAAEKGFRDALIAEAFRQLQSKCPKTRKSCRLVLITNDKNLSAYVEEMNTTHHNLHLLEGLEDCDSLLNTIASDVTVEFIESIQDAASGLFFTKDDESTVYYNEEIFGKIKSTYSSALKELPDGATSRKNGTVYIGVPRFHGKSGQTVTWSTPVTVEAVAYRRVSTSRPGFGGNDESASDTPLSQALSSDERPDPRQWSGLLSMLEKNLDTRKEEVAQGRTKFHVIWSVTVTTHKKLRNPKIERIDYAGTEWTDDQDEE